MTRLGRLDGVQLALYQALFASCAEEMGVTLMRTAHSPNIKERLDHSCAIFDALGRLVAQAAHIPVHLGAMPEAVAAVIARDPEPGDVFVMNDPYSGGTHLPDVTLISPIAIADELVGYAVTRAHHSDIGGMRAGSMPSDSRDVFQEGLVIPPVRLVRRGEIVRDVFDMVLANSRTPRLRRTCLRP